MGNDKDHLTAEESQEPAPPGYEAGPSTPHDEVEPLPEYSRTQPRCPQEIIQYRRNRDNYQYSCGLPHGTDLEAWREYIQLHPPSKKPWDERDAYENFHALSSFYLAIDQGKEDLVAFLIENDVITGNTTTVVGETPLLRAVTKKQARVVQTLLDLGAEKDAFGCASSYYDRDEGAVRVLRTPLQHAASLGHLVLVKLLMEQYACDDSIVAPDGQIALRLAAENGYQEVVDYLPLRRLGGFRRWKYTHRKALRRAMKALRKIGFILKFFAWYVPKALVWDLPKHAVVLPISRGCKWCWKNKKGFGPWCKHQILKVPERATKVAKWVGRGLAKIPKATKYVAKGCWKFGTETLPRWIKDISVWLWKLVTQGLPKAIGILARYIANGVLNTSKAIWNAVLKIISFLSTVVEAVISFLRSVTLADIWNGFVEVLKAVFVTFPKLLLSSIKSLGTLSYKLMKALLGRIGEVLWWIGYGLGWLALYIPRQIWKILKSFGESFMKGMHEIRVWFDPKAR